MSNCRAEDVALLKGYTSLAKLKAIVVMKIAQMKRRGTKIKVISVLANELLAVQWYKSKLECRVSFSSITFYL
jgi:hypothetical protein